jgi:Methyltransferase domain
MTRIDVIREALAALSGRTYLEIGVREGTSFDAVDAETKVAVDPEFGFRPPFRSSARKLLRARTGSFYFRMTSDRFFASAARRFAPFDVVFVDGLHTYEQSYADVLNALAVLAKPGVVLVHDCNPASEAAAAPTLEAAARLPGWVGEWNGEVYKALVRLRTHADVRACVIDCDHGVGVVAEGDPRSRLSLSPEAIARLEYRDLVAERASLLDLRPESALGDVLRMVIPTITPCRGSS